MFKLKTYNEYLNEKMALPVKKWVDIDLNKIPDEDGEHIWKMYTDTYLPQGMDLSAGDWKELQKKYKATWLIDIDKDKEPDAFIIYTDTKFGHKISLAGQNGQRDAKKQLINKTFELLETSGWYIEASMKVEDMLKRSRVNVVRDAKRIMEIIPEANILGDGYYERPLSKINKIIVKRIYGLPK